MHTIDPNLKQFPTPSQTVGPFYAIGLDYLNRQIGGEYRITGKLTDADGAGIPDALLEVWDSKNQAFARIPTAADGGFTIESQAFDFLNVHVLMRGLLRHVHTRVYYPDAAKNNADAVLNAVPATRRATLIAQGSGQHLTWDIHMQGAAETVFFTT
jgi:protocatechuate 3,4-dioxygenase, alpha subunit